MICILVGRHGATGVFHNVRGKGYMYHGIAIDICHGWPLGFPPTGAADRGLNCIG